MDTETPESATSLQYEPSASTGDPCSAGYSPTRKFPACVCPSLSCDFLLQMRPAYLQSSSSAQLMTDPPLRLCTDSLPRGWKTGLGCASNKSCPATRPYWGAASYRGREGAGAPMQEAVGSFENKLLSSVLSEFPGHVSLTKALCNPNILQLLPDLAPEPGLRASRRPHAGAAPASS